jgi:hypothetical protein
LPLGLDTADVICPSLRIYNTLHVSFRGVPLGASPESITTGGNFLEGWFGRSLKQRSPVVMDSGLTLRVPRNDEPRESRTFGKRRRDRLTGHEHVAMALAAARR